LLLCDKTADGRFSQADSHSSYLLLICTDLWMQSPRPTEEDWMAAQTFSPAKADALSGRNVRRTVREEHRVPDIRKEYHRPFMGGE